MILATMLLLLGTLPAQQESPTVIIEPASLDLDVDAMASLTARVTGLSPDQLRDATMTWFSTDPAVVAVDAEGRVTGLKPGSAQIGVLVSRAAGAVSASASGFAAVSVRPLPPASIDVAPRPARIPLGTGVPLEVVVRDRQGSAVDAPLEYETSSSEVVSLDARGHAFGRALGRAVVRVRAGGAVSEVPVEVVANPAADYRISSDRQRVRTGDVVRFTVLGVDDAGAEVSRVRPIWLIDSNGASIELDGEEGVFVAERPGRYGVTARIGESTVRSVAIDVQPREPWGRLEVVGHGLTAGHHAGDTWAFEGADGRDYAIIGTFMHDWLKVFDITDPASPVLTDSLQLDARRINDVKIHPNNRIAVVTREGASSRRNGIVLLDLAVPAHPRILSEYTETVTGGVHNVWIRGDLNLVYACHNGTSELHIIDISDPVRPREVGRWGLDKRFKTLHDVIVQDGYAYLSYWDDGVVILDVGAGTHGGTPTQPVFVSSFSYPQGNTHVAWRAGRYLFLGDEIFPDDWDASRPIEARGYIHVVDVTDIENPREVAHYEVPEAGAHNVWVENDLLYVGYYQGGLRVVDVSGELRGDLYRQGRELGALRTSSPDAATPNWSMTWGAQVFKGRIITADLNSGLWIARFVPTRPIS